MAKSITNGRQALQVSGSTVFRFREPTNPEMAKRMTQFVVDYSQQSAQIPNSNKRVLVEATHGVDFPLDTTNKSGRSSVFGALGRAEIGGSPDETGQF